MAADGGRVHRRYRADSGSPRARRRALQVWPAMRSLAPWKMPISNPAPFRRCTWATWPASMLEHQQHLAAKCAHACGMHGVEAFTLEASMASGAAALRTGFMAVAGGFHDIVAVCGAERLSHAPRAESTRALTTAFDRDETDRRGETFLSLNAALMRNYARAYDLPPRGFCDLRHQRPRQRSPQPQRAAAQAARPGRLPVLADAGGADPPQGCAAHLRRRRRGGSGRRAVVRERWSRRRAESRG